MVPHGALILPAEIAMVYQKRSFSKSPSHAVIYGALTISVFTLLITSILTGLLSPVSQAFSYLFAASTVYMSNCIPADPDISGIGIRISIYAQNLLCFVPVILNLRDWKVSADELRAIEGQSVGILIIAFAILISTIIQINIAELSSFHTAVILNLSWMNNTSTFIWLLLYLHHKSRPEKDAKAVTLPTTIRGWGEALFSPTPQDSKSTGFVLLLGSAHLSLMSGVGIWLWSNPSPVGDPISCDPAIVILGQNFHLSSKGLGIASLVMYLAFLAPQYNLVIPYLFFFIPHVEYNRYRQRRLSHADTESAQANRPPYSPRFVYVGLVLLFLINILFLIDTELTVSRAEHLQDKGEREWGFGQVLAMLLLLIPLRDIISSFASIRRQRWEKQEHEELLAMLPLGTAAVEKATAEVRLRRDFRTTALSSCDLRHVRQCIEDGADPNMIIDDVEWFIGSLGSGSPLQCLSWKGDHALVQLLLDHGADVNMRCGRYGTALQAAAFTGEFGIVQLLLDKGADVNAIGGEYGTALIAACQTGYPAKPRKEIVQLLIGKGADIHYRHIDHGSALQVAIKRGRKGRERILREAGAIEDADPGAGPL